MTLTARAIEQAKPKDKAYKLTDIPGLYLHVLPTGTKAWRTNYKECGKQVTKTYGRWPDVSLAEARRLHTAAPADTATKPAAPTFEKVMRDFLRVKLPSLKNVKHQLQVVNTLERFVLPKIGKSPVDTIPRSTLVEVVQEVQDGGALVETAHRVAGRISMVFDYAQDVGLIDRNPAHRLTRVLQERKVKKPMSCIPPEEVPALLRAIGTYDEDVTRLGLLLAAHLFLRTTEIRQLKWFWWKREEDVIVVPAEIMKMKRPHVVPLSRQAKALLDELELHTEGKDYALESAVRRGHPMSENTLLFALYRLGYRGKMTVHGFRSLASTVLNEKSPFKPDAIERQLAHKEKDAVRAAYHRAEYLDERRQMMQWWSDWLDSQQPATTHDGASG